MDDGTEQFKEMSRLAKMEREAEIGQLRIELFKLEKEATGLAGKIIKLKEEIEKKCRELL